MRPYATTIYQLFILFIGSVFTMTSCEPVNEKTDQKAVSAQQAKEQTSFNNPEPMTGFEHTVTFDFQGTKMVIPYGYLAR
ncbi:RTX iron-regulated FrpC family protein, partial [Neisseria meningitidis]